MNDSFEHARVTFLTFDTAFFPSPLSVCLICNNRMFSGYSNLINRAITKNYEREKCIKTQWYHYAGARTKSSSEQRISRRKNLLKQNKRTHKHNWFFCRECVFLNATHSDLIGFCVRSLHCPGQPHTISLFIFLFV